MLETDPIVDAVCAKLQARSAVGLKKYGTTLADNVATVKEKLTHIQEELMDGANYVEWLLQEKEMPTPMTIEMEAQVKADIKELSMAAGIADTFHGRNCCAALDRIEAALLTKPTENVTCENLSNTDERQAALDALNRLHAYSDYYGCSQDFKTVSAALQSPRVPDNMFKKLGSLIKAVDGGTFEDDPHDAIIDAAIRTLSSPRVPVIEGLDDAIEYVRGFAIDVDEEGLDRDGNARFFFKVVKAASEYAELQKGV